MWSLEISVGWPDIRRGVRRILPGVASVLTACSLGPDYQRPDISAPTAWRADGQTSITAESLDQAGAAWPSAGWWREFNSPELNELMSEARGANDDIAEIGRAHV